MVWCIYLLEQRKIRKRGLSHMNRITENQNIELPSKDSYLFLNGQSGKLELLVSPANPTLLAPNLPSPCPIAIICHPHPLYQGTMNNKVVHTIHKALHNIGFTTIRFNYRGVGRSEGKYGDSIGESEDLHTIIEWIKAKQSNNKILLAGFSFGAFIALRESKKNTCLQLISIAPAVQNQDYQSCMPVSCPWLVIQGEADEVVPPELVFDFIDSLEKKPDLIRLPNTSHFFHGELITLRDKIIDYISNQNF